jgi:hypothetical protein
MISISDTLTNLTRLTVNHRRVRVFVDGSPDIVSILKHLSSSPLKEVYLTYCHLKPRLIIPSLPCTITKLVMMNTETTDGMAVVYALSKTNLKLTCLGICPGIDEIYPIITELAKCQPQLRDLRVHYVNFNANIAKKFEECLPNLKRLVISEGKISLEGLYNIGNKTLILNECNISPNQASQVLRYIATQYNIENNDHVVRIKNPQIHIRKKGYREVEDPYKKAKIWRMIHPTNRNK